MHLTGMLVGGLPPFIDGVKFRFDERVNVFIGPNASGKSTLLLALASHFNALADDGKRPFVDWEFVRFADYEFDQYADDVLCGGDKFPIISASADWFDPNSFTAPELSPVVVHIAAVRTGLPGISGLKNSYGEGWTADADDVLAAPFSGLQTQRALEALGEKARIANQANPEALRNFAASIETANACSMAICREVIQDKKAHNYIPKWDLEGHLNNPVADPGKAPVIRGAAVNTSDISDFDILPEAERPFFLANFKNDADLPLYLGHLSSGTEGTLLWIRWLAFKMVCHYGFIDGWEKQPAILLIDEIENHLHPTWQRRVIPALLKYFPGLQIFATTHSPFVVAGLKAGQVHMLKRDADGVITASANSEDILGWTMDEILRAFMGVDDPTDDATAAAARELRELRNAGPSADAGDEERRQARMQELRRLVDRDLLAGGPRAAQRELFEQQFAEALEKYQRSRGLNQEGS